MSEQEGSTPSEQHELVGVVGAINAKHERLWRAAYDEQEARERELAREGVRVPSFAALADPKLAAARERLASRKRDWLVALVEHAADVGVALAHAPHGDHATVAHLDGELGELARSVIRVAEVFS